MSQKKTRTKAATKAKVSQEANGPDKVLYNNKLKAFTKGHNLAYKRQLPPTTGNVGWLVGVYIMGFDDIMALGITGAEIAGLLCEQGYLQYWHDGVVVEAGTPTEEQPDYESVREQKSNYQFVKQAPKRDDWVRGLRESIAENKKIASGE